MQVYSVGKFGVLVVLFSTEANKRSASAQPLPSCIKSFSLQIVFNQGSDSNLISNIKIF